APAIVLLFRLLQGFALGGEVGPTTAFMAEAAPAHRRGLYISMQYATQDCAVLTAGGPRAARGRPPARRRRPHRGWGAARRVGASIVPFGIALRRRLPETLERAAPAVTATAPLASPRGWRDRVRPYQAIVVLGLMMLTSGTIGSYTLSYMTTYALDTLRLPA